MWDGQTFRYPAFQFDANGRPTSRVEELIAVLPRYDDGSGRDAALWLFAPDAALGGLTPAKMFPADPSRMITLARILGSGSEIHD